MAENLIATSTSTPVKAAASQSTGTLKLSIGGTAAGVNQDTLVVSGTAVLAGHLVIRFTDGYTPSPGEEFTVVRAAGGMSGRFSSITSNRKLNLRPRYDAHHAYVKVTR